MSTKKLYFEYSDGSYLEAVVKDGELIKCPDIRISPPTRWGTGAVTLDQAIEFLTDIKKAKRETLKEDIYLIH